MNESSKSFLRSLAAIVFLAVLGAVLARPIFAARDGERVASRRPPAKVVPRSEPRSEKSPSPSAEATQPAAPTTFAYGDYPKACLRPVAPPTGNGLVAAFHYGEPGGPNQISIGSPTGAPTVSFAGMAPLQWSPGGRWLVSRGLELHDQSGRPYRVGRLGGLEPWAWSPIADCLLVLAGDELVVVQPPDRKTVLVQGPLDWFGFLPGGRELFTSEGTIDLSQNPVRPRRPHSVPALSRCDLGRSVEQETCAPAGSLVAGIHHDRLVLGVDGENFFSSITRDNGWIDSFPEWGPQRTGVLFVRTPLNGGEPEVWFVAEGGNPRPTGLKLPDRDGLSKNDWPSYLDWNLTPPSGSMPLILDE